MRNPFLFSPDDGDGGGNGGGQTILGGGDSQQQQQQGQQQQQQAAAGWDFRSALDDSGSFKQGWHETLPDDLKPYAGSLSKYPNATELLRGLGNAQKLIGQRPQELKPPGPDATPEQKATWFKTIGVPEKPEEYGLKKPEKLPEGVPWSDEDAAAFAAKAHELGLTPAQVQAIAAFDIERAARGVQKGQGEITAYIEGQKTALKAEWGEKFEANRDKALATAQLLGLDPNDAEIGNSAKMIKALHAASQLMSEDKFVGSDKAGMGMSRADQAEDMLRNKANPWHNALWGREGPERQTQAQQLRARLLGIKEDVTNYRP